MTDTAAIPAAEAPAAPGPARTEVVITGEEAIEHPERAERRARAALEAGIPLAAPWWFSFLAAERLRAQERREQRDRALAALHLPGALKALEQAQRRLESPDWTPPFPRRSGPGGRDGGGQQDPPPQEDAPGQGAG